MPIVITAPVHKDTEESVSAHLVDKDGKPTLQAEVIERFIDDVDFDDVFEALLADPETKGVIESAEGWIKFDAELNCFVEAEKGEEGAVLGTIETLTGDVLAETVDMDDMANMFDFHMVNEHDHDSLQGKLEATMFDYGKDESSLDEFNKGDFKKVHKGALKTTGGTGPAMVNRMLGAMIAKQAIKRAKASSPGTPKAKGGFSDQGGQKGAGYRGGDYEKHAPGYGSGTGSGVKVWTKYRTRKQAELAKKAKKIKGKKAPKQPGAVKKAVAAKGAAAKAKAVKSAAAKKGKGKKLESTGTDGRVVTDVAPVPAHPPMTENSTGAGLAARMIATKKYQPALNGSK